MIDDRLVNWALHYRDKHERGYCYSIEGRMYKAPWRQWLELSEIPHPVVIDWKDAENVEAAWRRMFGQRKKLLKFWYMTRMPVHVMCRKTHIKLFRLENELSCAKQDLQKILDMLSPGEIIEQQFDPLRREDQRTDAVFLRPKETEPA